MKQRESHGQGEGQNETDKSKAKSLTAAKQSPKEVQAAPSKNDIVDGRTTKERAVVDLFPNTDAIDLFPDVPASQVVHQPGDTSAIDLFPSGGDGTGTGTTAPIDLFADDGGAPGGGAWARAEGVDSMLPLNLDHAIPLDPAKGTHIISKDTTVHQFAEVGATTGMTIQFYIIQLLHSYFVWVGGEGAAVMQNLAVSFENASSALFGNTARDYPSRLAQRLAKRFKCVFYISVNTDDDSPIFTSDMEAILFQRLKTICSESP